MNTNNKISKISHIITFIISIVLSLFCVNGLGLFKNSIFWGDFVLLFCIIGFFYCIFFFPVDFINKSIINIENDNFEYEMTDFVKEYKMHNVPSMYAGGKGFIISIIFLINLILIAPIKLIRKFISGTNKEE